MEILKFLYGCLHMHMVHVLNTFGVQIWHWLKGQVWINMEKCYSFGITFVATLTLGSQPNQGLTKVQAKSEARESHFMFRECRRMWRFKPHTLPNELPLWELESWWTPKFLKSDFRGHWIEEFFISLEKSSNLDV
jgi:hypothetical protein